MNDLRELPLKLLPKTAPRTISILNKLGIESFYDLIHYFPSRYEDYSTIITISDLQSLDFRTLQNEDEPHSGKYTIKGVATGFNNIFTRRGLTMQKVTIEDETGSIVVTWFNQTYLRQVIKSGSYISVSGKAKMSMKGVELQPEAYEILSEQNSPCLHTARIVPIYPLTRGISAKTLREKIAIALHSYEDSLTEFLPEKLMKKNKLIQALDAYKNIHFPIDNETLHEAQRRIGYDEVLVLQLASQLMKRQWNLERVVDKLSVEEHASSVQSFIKVLPFTLTDAQNRVFSEICADLKQTQPMNRLLQGDVGSGKTIIAALTSYLVFLNNKSTLFMAPTEILAQQHFQSLKNIFNLVKSSPHISLVTGKKSIKHPESKEREIIVGTHALLSDKRKFDDIGLVIVDEQHKFGVAQRAQLKEKGAHPHLLSMTATPIPRTVALTLYGELDMSIIDEMPVGRLNVKTHLIDAQKREKGYEWIKEKVLNDKEQAFIICPFVEESSSETLKSIKSAKAEYEHLSREIFPELKLGLLHGKLKSDEKDAVMRNFSEGKLDILVSTPVVEVGIDVPNATMIFIEGAERFGLAQLHQLRGRVGRSDKQSYCFLLESESSEVSHERLRYFEKEHDGYKLALFDLKRRGSGSLFGTQQHGDSDIRIARLDDLEFIEKILSDALEFIETEELDSYPELSRRVTALEMKRIARN